MTGAKKVSFTKNHFFHARKPPEEIFEFFSCSGFIFMTDFCTFTRLLLNFVTSEAVLIESKNVPQAYIDLILAGLQDQKILEQL